MSVQVLIATMHQKDHSLLEKMNIQSDAIVGNQCERNSVEAFSFRGFEAIYLNSSERGVGRNRNHALLRATGDIVLFADDDVLFADGYPEKVENVFHRLPDADVVIFSWPEDYPKGYSPKHTERVYWFNFLRYGAARMAVRRNRIQEKGISFNLNFGGGTEHQHGEDTLFYADCLRRGLKIYVVPESISRLTEGRESTWNKGYDEQYLIDQGCLYRAVSPKWWRLLCLQDAIRKQKRYKKSWWAAYKQMQ